MARLDRVQVSVERPCEVCGEPELCFRSVDGELALCRRKGYGEDTHDANASFNHYWIFKLEEPTSARTPGASLSADPNELGGVYEALLDNLSVDHAHRQELHKRGLTEGEIKRARYRTLPAEGREELALKLVESFGSEACSRVPELYVRENGRLSIAGASGLLTPVRDPEGRIVSLRLSEG